MNAMRNKLSPRHSPWLLALMLVSFVVANLLPGVAMAIIDSSSKFYTPGSEPVSIPGWLCTLYHPAGWASVLVHCLGILFFLVFWLRRKRLPRAFVSVPIAGFVISLLTTASILLSNSENRLLVGHYLWVFSLFVAIPLYRSLATVREEPDPSLEGGGEGAAAE